MRKRGIVVFVIAFLFALTTVIAAGSFQTRASIDTRPAINLITGKTFNENIAGCPGEFTRLNTCLRECVAQGGKCIHRDEGRQRCYRCDMSEPVKEPDRLDYVRTSCSEVNQVLALAGVSSEAPQDLFDTREVCAASDCSGSCIDVRLRRLYPDFEYELKRLGLKNKKCFVCDAQEQREVVQEVSLEVPASTFVPTREVERPANIPGPLHPGDFSCSSKYSNFFDTVSQCEKKCSIGCNFAVYSAWVLPNGHVVSFPSGFDKNCWYCPNAHL